MPHHPAQKIVPLWSIVHRSLEPGLGYDKEIHSNTEFLVLNDQAEHDTAIRGSPNTGEDNNMHGDKIKFSECR